MNLLGARIEPEKDYTAVPQPGFNLDKEKEVTSKVPVTSGKAEWTMDLPIANA